jgi:putative PIN family toxin of toxin-antitoxin system
MSDEGRLTRAVVDTNILIRGTLSPGGASALAVDAIYHRRCLLITSRTQLSELHRVLSRPRFVHRYDITSDQRHRLIARLYSLATIVRPRGHLAICRDPSDDYLIEMALLGKASHLVSEDNDLFDDADIVELLRQYDIQLVRVGTFAQTLTATS